MYSRHFIYPFHPNLFTMLEPSSVFQYHEHTSIWETFSLVSGLYQKQIKAHNACQFAKGVTGCPLRSRLSFCLLIKSNGNPAFPFLCAWIAIIFALNEVCYQIVEPNSTISVSNTLECANAVSGYSITYVVKIWRGWAGGQISLSSP